MVGQREERAESIAILERLKAEHARGDVYGVGPMMIAIAALKEPSPS